MDTATGSGELTVRPLGDGDGPALRALLAHLAAPRIDARHAHLPPLAEEVRHELLRGPGLVAETAAGHPDRLVGVALWRDAGAGRGRATVAIADGWRLSDAGHRLLRALALDARAAGVVALVAEIEPRNAALRAAARALGIPELREGTRIEIPLALAAAGT